ncbi:MarR family winged helix-turn-helix transcriptional regulator [Polymorphum gilvum]|uniref:Transcriptional regulator, MarR family n=1 Tax=Polymorphum gilvum (strain LMG 25793 / CGMCC 1.9160 / SL003B-26A1) TaxID=991905 RepID=F2J1Q5_POLGS|nr:MarR family winged helix-turn-helix transcriptional regulator [Polymorphum gilvum]ADZ70856.1 Transcriptional regulator, MarR family [Polymorphum gilvum SL003B-26A1]
MKSVPDGPIHQAGLFDAEPPVGLDNFLPLKLIAAARLVERRLARALQADHGLALAEWQVLAALIEVEDLSVRDLGPRTGLDAVAISRAAMRLTDRKLVKKAENRKDRRLVVLRPTRAGRQLGAGIAARLAPLEAEILRGVGVSDRIRLSNLLGALQLREPVVQARPRSAN